MSRCALRLFAAIIAIPAIITHAQNSSAFGKPLAGNGDVSRDVLTYEQLLGSKVPSSPVNDTSGFAIPENAAEPSEMFEGTLTLSNPATNGGFHQISDIFRSIPVTDSPWKHLAPFSYQFTQSGSYLVPTVQGLSISGSPVWNYIIGPGRVWQESGDRGYMRASLPFALVQRNQNCVHNGEMTFLFSQKKSPNISPVYYQITQETCYPMKFDLWGSISAVYKAGAVSDGEKIVREQAAEVARRLPTKPFEALTIDFPQAAFNLQAFSDAYKDPANITTYGLVFHGINYVSGCRTRFGEYAFCSDMRVPSYSIAKSVFAGVALMHLGQLY
ncbi:MAG: hypothetical protein JOY93_04145, partial [Acidobacteriales bacterium]|nr:hypothetical protein [Terriglobales bacterium]